MLIEDMQIYVTLRDERREFIAKEAQKKALEEERKASY